METLPILRSWARRVPARSLMVALCAIGVAHASPWQVWTTDRDGAHPLARQADLTWGTTATGEVTIEIRPQHPQQIFLGVGAAITDASATVINQRLVGDARRAFLREVFATPAALGLDVVRVTIGGSDFSQRHYSLDDTDGQQPDPELRHYADQAETIEVRQLVREIHALTPTLRVIASPWSAPGWMKTPTSLIGGRLQPTYYAAYARYLLRFADDYAAAGVPLYALTVQNEPAYEAPTYASMRMDADERARFLTEHLGPRLRQRAQAPRVLEWDHNWSAPGSPLSVLGDRGTRDYLGGVAWHCYGGTPMAQRWVQQVVPALDAYITECSSGDWQREWPDTFRSMVGTVLIEGIRQGARAAVLWNLALDEQHGPHIGGCPNCRGIVTIHPDGRIERHAEYYALAHIGRFVRPGDRVIESDSVADGVRSVAFLGADGHTVTVVLQNASDHAVTVALRLGARTALVPLAAGTVATVHGRP